MSQLRAIAQWAKHLVCKSDKLYLATPELTF